MISANPQTILLEVVVDSVESAIAAQKGVARRVELCAGLSAGGITPSAGMIVSVRKLLTIDLHVMIRPRGGNFCYSEAEFGVMQRDVLVAKKLGADGVVFGILKSDRTVDTERTGRLVQLASPLSVTFHRAFDLVADPHRAMEEIIALKIDRILTSGQARTAREGAALIRDLALTAGSRISIMPGSGINKNNVAAIIRRTGAREIHVCAGVSKVIRSKKEKMLQSEQFLVMKEKVRDIIAASMKSKSKT